MQQEVCGSENLPRAAGLRGGRVRLFRCGAVGGKGDVGATYEDTRRAARFVVRLRPTQLANSHTQLGSDALN